MLINRLDVDTDTSHPHVSNQLIFRLFLPFDTSHLSVSKQIMFTHINMEPYAPLIRLQTYMLNPLPV